MINEATWEISDMLEVQLKDPSDFLKIKETLSRIGVASKREKKLFQSCHILHKRGKYYITHFKELFKLDGKPSNLSENDIERRNTIVCLLAEWNLVGVDALPAPKAPLSQIEIISFKDKGDWALEAKYTVGNNESSYSN